MRRRYSLKTIKIEEMSTEVEIRQGCFDFIAHYPLEECVWRLYAQHEKADPFAWRGEIRTDVKVDESDHSVSRFEVCRVKKRSNTTAEAAVIIKGELEALDKQQTQVRGTIEILLIWLILPTLLIIVPVILNVMGKTTITAWWLYPMLFAVFIGSNVIWQRLGLISVLENTFRPYDLWGK